jgi:hypothetical protein
MFCRQSGTSCGRLARSVMSFRDELRLRPRRWKAANARGARREQPPSVKRSSERRLNDSRTYTRWSASGMSSRNVSRGKPSVVGGGGPRAPTVHGGDAQHRNNRAATRTPRRAPRRSRDLRPVGVSARAGAGDDTAARPGSPTAARASPTVSRSPHVIAVSKVAIGRRAHDRSATMGFR